MRSMANFLLLTVIVTLLAFAITKPLGLFGIVPDSAHYRIGLATGLAPFIVLLSRHVHLFKTKDN